MCGRYSLTISPEDIIENFLIDEFLVDDWSPRFNIAPSQMVLGAVEHAGKRRAGYFRWGLTPSWVKETSNWKPLINARSETMDEKSSFKHLVNKRRCVIFADGFYEWKKENGKRVPVRFVKLDRKPFAFAGLWDKSHTQSHPTCTIITTSPNNIVSPIHNRMPAIIQNEQLSFWLDHQNDFEQLKSLLEPFPSDKMISYDVSPQVNSPRVDHPSLIEMVE
ncbi:SOS response-associated peptidase [Bacillus carboniphilus]|uniref:Abasic site processing protein n=1 Tax=Bacillus carboniphilus TaxID=86663 RepID=A0ABP3GPE1_9BACI